MENAPTTGRSQVNGYFEVENKIRQPKAEKLMSSRTRFGPALGTREHNRQYCSKENNAIIFNEEEKRLSKAEEHDMKLFQATQSSTKIEGAAQYPRSNDRRTKTCSSRADDRKFSNVWRVSSDIS
jgi:hypothetical protein